MPPHIREEGGFLMVKTLLLALAIAVVIAVPANARSSAVTLKGEVGPGYSIEVEKAGKDLKTIKAGRYKIKVEDKASIHNFHLFGPGLNKKTGISFSGETTWTIKLKPGRYTYQCDSHAFSGMKGHFKVTK
jgi:plastocyanin